MSRRALVTLHDVGPAAMQDCLDTLDTLRQRGVAPVTLLVVPGLDWTESDLDVLRRLERDGYPLAGHGWSHRAPSPASLWHRAHAAVISRDEAEHLSRPRAELRSLVARCSAWFDTVGLTTPDFYVPPAWAMGRLTRADLAELPFRYYETLTGLVDSAERRLRLLPLVGYLADTRARAVALRGSNALNRAIATLVRRPLRVSIHPPDLRLRVADDLLRLFDADWQYLTVPEAMA